MEETDDEGAVMPRSQSPPKQVAWVEESKGELLSRAGSPPPTKHTIAKDMLAHVARVDGSARGKSAATGPPSSSSSSARHISPGATRPLSAISHMGTASITDTNNPLVDRLINELRRLLKFQQKETREARKQNVEMNKLLFERNEFVKVTIASLKREEYNSAMLLEEVRRVKRGQKRRKNAEKKGRRLAAPRAGPDEVDGAERGEPSVLVEEEEEQEQEEEEEVVEVVEEEEAVDEFESLRREIVRLHQEATKAELLSRVKDEQSAVLQERINALEASGLTLVNRKFGGRNATFAGPSVGVGHDDDDEEEERQRRRNQVDARSDVPSPTERLMLLAVKLKSLVREARGDVQEDPELLDAESYAQQLVALLLGEGDVGPDGKPTLGGKFRPGRGSDPAMLAQLEAKEAELQQMRQDYEARLAAYEADATTEQAERAKAQLALQEAAALRLEVEALKAEDERKASEIEQLYLDVLAMDRDLQERKRDIEAIEESMAGLTARLEDELQRAEGLAAALAEQTALLGDANAHIGTLGETLQTERADAQAAAATAAAAIAQHLGTILDRKSRITALEQEAVRAEQSHAKAMAAKARETEKIIAEYTGQVGTRDARIADLLLQIDEWEKRMSLWEIIQGYEAENVELRASLVDYKERYRMRRERLGMLAEDGLFLSLLQLERGKYAVKCGNLDDAMSVVAELMEKNAVLYRTMAKERIDFADAKEDMSNAYARRLVEISTSNEAHSRRQVAVRTADVTVLRGLLTLLEQDAQQEAFAAKDAVRVREEKIESLQQTIEELDRILFDKDVLLLRLRAENAAYRAGEVDQRVKTKVAAQALKVVLAEDPSNAARAPRQRLKLVEEALVKAEARATMWERLAAGYQLGAQSTHSVAIELDACITGGLEYAYGSLFNASVRERVFSLRAAAIVSSRTITGFTLDALHAWAEQHDMTDRDEDKALRSVQLSWPALESMVDIQVFCDLVNAPDSAATTGDARMDEIERIDRREEELRRRLFVLFGPGRVGLPEMRAVHDLRAMLDLSVQQVDEVLGSMEVPGLRLGALAERAAHALLDEYEVRSTAVLRRDFDAVMAELDGPGRLFSSPQFLVHCHALHQEVHLATRLRQKYAELKLAFHTAKLQTAIAESKVHPSIRKRHIHPADGLPTEACRACLREAEHDAPDEATDKMERRMAVCREALQKELARLVTRGGLSVGRDGGGGGPTGHLLRPSSSSSSAAKRAPEPDSLHRDALQSRGAQRAEKDGLLLRTDENLESIELQLAQFGGEWDKARLVFVKLLRAKLQDELHLRAEQRRLGARLHEAERDAGEVLALAEEAAVAWGRGEDGGSSMVSQLIYETQQLLVASNERIRSALQLVTALRLKEVKALQEHMHQLEDHIEAIQDPGRLDTSAYPPLTFAVNAFSGEEEGLSLCVLQAELAEIRTLDLSLDRLENVAEVVEDLLLHQTHRDGPTLQGLRETLVRLDVVDMQSLPNHHMMKVTAHWAPHTFPMLSAAADAQEQLERDSFLGSVHLSQQLDAGPSLGGESVVYDGDSGGRGSPESSLAGDTVYSHHSRHSHHSQLSIKPGTPTGSIGTPDRGNNAGLLARGHKPRSSKIVPTELEETYQRTTSALAESLVTLKEEMAGMNERVERSLEDHQEAMNIAEASILTARVATTSAAQASEAASQASKAAADAQALALAMQEANAKKTCAIM